MIRSRMIQDDLRMTSGWHQVIRMNSGWPQDDFTMTSGWPHDDLRMASGWFQDDPRMTSGWPIITPGSPRITQEWPNIKTERNCRNGRKLSLYEETNFFSGRTGNSVMNFLWKDAGQNIHQARHVSQPKYYKLTIWPFYLSSGLWLEKAH